MKIWAVLTLILVTNLGCADQKNSRTKGRPSEAIEEIDAYLESQKNSYAGNQRGEANIPAGSVVVEEGAIQVPYSVRISRRKTEDLSAFFPDLSKEVALEPLEVQVLSQENAVILPPENLTGRIQVTKFLSGIDPSKISVLISTLDSDGSAVVGAVSKNDIFIQEDPNQPGNFKVNVLITTTSAVLVFGEVPDESAFALSSLTDGPRLQSMQISKGVIEIQGSNLNLISGMRVKGADVAIAVSAAEQNRLSATFSGNLTLALRKIGQLIFSTAYGDTASTSHLEVKTDGDYTFSGNVSVGLGLSSATLAIAASDTNAAVGQNTKASLKIVNSSSSSYNRNAEIQFFNNNTDAKNSISGVSGVYTNWDATNGAGGDLAFFTKLAPSEDSPSEKMRIKDNGRVGIGTTEPASKLHVKGNTTVENGVSEWVGTSPVLFLLNSNGVTDQRRFVISNEGAGTVLRWVNDNNSSVFSESLYLRNNGNVGVGTTSPSEKLHVNGSIRVETLASAAATAVCIDGNKTLASCSSSIRYKENVADLDLGLEAVMRMRPVTFKWKNRDETDLGFIAEEVHEVSPLMANYRDGKIEGVKYGQVTAVLVKAVQELNAFVTRMFASQANEVAELRAANEALRQDNESIKAVLCEMRPDAALCAK